MTEQSNQNDLINKLNELEKRLNEMEIKKNEQPSEPVKKNKTPQYIIDANKRYYHKKKNNLDFKIKIRDRNRKAREKLKPIKQEEPKEINQTINKPITISFYDDDIIGF
jgi:hypothetical protein